MRNRVLSHCFQHGDGLLQVPFDLGEVAALIACTDKFLQAAVLFENGVLASVNVPELADAQQGFGCQG